MNQCSEFKQLTPHQSIQNFTCISCNTKTQTLDDRNVLIQPLRKEDETLDLNQILSKPKVSSCNKNCEKCGLDKQHEVNEELLICPPVLIINLQRFKTEQRVNFHGRRKSLRLINNSQFQVDNVVSYGKNCQDVDPSPILLLKETVYSLRSVIIHLGSDLEEPGNHIVTLLNTSKGWITCNDTELSNPSTTLSPLGKQGYLFIYEKVDDPPLTMPNIQSSMPMNTEPVIENKEEIEAKETNPYQETNFKCSVDKNDPPRDDGTLQRM